MDKLEKEKEANYIFAKALLDDLNQDVVKGTIEEYEELKDTYLQGKVTLESWGKYWKEHAEKETPSKQPAKKNQP